MIKVALTGNIGMGKTTVGNIFSSLGALVIDTDDIVRQLLNNEDVKKRICEVFGQGILREGTLDKKALADIVFNDTARLRELEDILHPLVFEEVNRIAGQNVKYKVLIVEAPILFERGYQVFFDKVVAVFCNEDVALKRSLSKGYSKNQVMLRLRSQMPIAKKCELSDFVVDNNGSIEDIHEQVNFIYQILERMADGRGKGDIQ